MNAAQVTTNPLLSPETSLSLPEQALSALIDGELEEAEFDTLMATASQGGTEILANWHSYLLIGDALRGSEVVAAAQAPGAFLAGIRERLQSEAAPAAPSRPLEPVPVPVPHAVQIHAPASNDALFRWKLVAGVASLAAVTAVSWGVLSGSPSGVGAVGPQMAAVPQVIETPVPTTAVAAVPPNTVVVNTGQGALIRDARLEELLAEHRQNAGMSALQMPTGFIRNATYDASGR